MNNKIEKRWICTHAGSIDNLQLEEFTLGEQQQDERDGGTTTATNATTPMTIAPNKNIVTVAIKAIGLNFADIFAILGLYGATPKGKFIPGLEFSGQVISVASLDNSGNFKPGDRVMGVTRFGAYQTCISVDCAYLRHLPDDDWTFSEGASFLVQALTAYYGLVELGNMKIRNNNNNNTNNNERSMISGQHGRKAPTVLIHSIAGGVGLWAMELCRLTGAKVVGTIGNESKRQFLLDRFPNDLKSEQIIVRSANMSEFESQLQSSLQYLSESQFDIVFDSLGGDYFHIGYKLIGKGGRLISFGSGQMMPTGNRPNWFTLGWKYLWRPKLDPLEMVGDNKSVMAFNLIWLYDQVELLGGLVDQMIIDIFGTDQRCCNKTVKPFVDREFNFESECLDAIKYFQSGKSVGKVVLLTTPTTKTQ